MVYVKREVPVGDQLTEGSSKPMFSTLWGAPNVNSVAIRPLEFTEYLI